MAVFTWAADYGSSVSTKPSVLRAKFGDGYEQRVGDGLNSLVRTWNVTFTVAPDVATAIDEFLSGLKGVTNFDWTPPRGAAGKWVCETEWTVNVVNAGQHALSAIFQEVFEP